VVGC